MTDDTEQELLRMLQEPTVDKVRRDQIKADILMQQVGRAIAPQVNAVLKRLADKLAAEQEPLGAEFEQVWDENVDVLYKK